MGPLRRDAPPGAAEGGLFAEQELEVEFVGCARAPEWTLAHLGRLTCSPRRETRVRSRRDLQGARAARWSIPWFAQEYAGALSYMGLDQSVIVDSEKPDAQLERGKIDVIPTWLNIPDADLAPTSLIPVSSSALCSRLASRARSWIYESCAMCR